MAAILIRQSEASWQDQVIQYAELRGWAWMHVLRGFVKGRWVTNTQGPLGHGWPDLIMVRGDRVLAVELKAQDGKLSNDQMRVLAMFDMTNIECYVWRPLDLAQVMDVLA